MYLDTDFETPSVFTNFVMQVQVLHYIHTQKHPLHSNSTKEETQVLFSVRFSNHYFFQNKSEVSMTPMSDTMIQ